VGCLSFSLGREINVILFSGSGGVYTDFRIYHIDIHAATMHLLTTITRRYYCFDFHATGDFLATGLGDQGNYLIAIKRIPFAANTTENELIFNLGPDLVRYYSRLRL
jgi:hypothetical protein